MLTIEPGSRTHLSKNRLKRHLDELERVEEALRQYRHLAKAREFVNGQPRATVTLTTTAHAIGISQSHLARLFQEKVGMSFPPLADAPAHLQSFDAHARETDHSFPSRPLVRIRKLPLVRAGVQGGRRHVAFSVPQSRSSSLRVSNLQID